MVTLHCEILSRNLPTLQTKDESLTIPRSLPSGVSEEGALRFLRGDQSPQYKGDYYDSLRWLFVAAARWELEPGDRVFTMTTALVQARALYEFFYNPDPKKDDASAHHFCDAWPGSNLDAELIYDRYMASKKPVQKRVAHLTFARENHSGGVRPDEGDHLKNQVMNIALDIKRLAKEFACHCTPTFKHAATLALDAALDDAATEAKRLYGKASPLSP